MELNDLQLFDVLKEGTKKIVGRFELSKSDFTAGSVATALITNKGNIYTGICLEVACGIGFCAEHAAIAEMLKHREKDIYMLLSIKEDMIIPPCGRCRELMFQINTNNVNTKIWVSENELFLLDKLLPERWGTTAWK
jgi:cytidine deaminase